MNVLTQNKTIRRYDKTAKARNMSMSLTDRLTYTKIIINAIDSEISFENRSHESSVESPTNHHSDDERSMPTAASSGYRSR